MLVPGVILGRILMRFLGPSRHTIKEAPCDVDQFFLFFFFGICFFGFSFTCRKVPEQRVVEPYEGLPRHQRGATVRHDAKPSVTVQNVHMSALH